MSPNPIPCPEGLSYLPYQLEGIRFALEHPSTLIADEMGLGKTVQAIGAINALAPKTVLIVCPASLKLNWRNELLRWLAIPARIGLIGGKGETVFTNTFRRDESVTSIEIVNWNILDRINPSEIGLLIPDEAHYAKEGKSQRTKELRRLNKLRERAIFLTGTPILSRPIELFQLLSMLCPEEFDKGGYAHGKPVGPGEGAGMMAFAKRYCGAHQRKGVWYYNGATNLDELQARLRDTKSGVMIRRMKADVLTELPPKRRALVVVGDGSEPDDYPDIQDNGVSIEDQIKALSLGRKLVFNEIAAVRHETALRKVPYVIEHVANALESGSEKVIVFAHHKDVLDGIYKGLGKYGRVLHTGEVSIQARQDAVEVFQQDPNCRLFLASLATAREGLTLTASAHEVFAEWAWTPSEVAQAEDRAHRIGQRECVLSEFLAFDRSLDAKIAKMLVRKAAVIAKAIDAPKQGRLF